MSAQMYIHDISTGSIRFTKEGRKELEPYFQKAGIGIDSINTVRDYFEARKAASPYFMEHLADRAAGWPDTDEFQLLKTAIFGTAEELENFENKIDFKSTLKVIR